MRAFFLDSAASVLVMEHTLSLLQGLTHCIIKLAGSQAFCSVYQTLKAQ